MGSDELSRMLTASGALDGDVRSLLDSGWNTSSQQHVICMAYCKAAVVHAISQRVLIEERLHGTQSDPASLRDCCQGRVGSSWGKGRVAGEVLGAGGRW